MWKRNEENRELKQYQRFQIKENVREKDQKIGWSFELATSDKKYVNDLNRH